MSASIVRDNVSERIKHIALVADELPVAVIIHRLDELKVVYMNQHGLDAIGLTLEEVKQLSSEEYHFRYFNTEDSNYYIPKILELVRLGGDEKGSYFQQVHTPEDKEWKLFASNMQVFARDKNGRATHLITIASFLDPVHQITVKINRLMDEVGFLRQNFQLFSELTKREREILKYMAMGLNSGEIAERLFIATATVDTHRRNVRTKLNLRNNYDAVKFAQAYNLL